MLSKKNQFPQEDELVLCTVTTVQPHAVFVHLDEYDRTGLVHISEVAPGRIRNIREFVKESKKIVCKVLRVSKEKGHIDLSLRRVNETQRREKSNQIKQEQLAEKIIERVAQTVGKTPEQMAQALEPLLQKYGTFYPAFEEVSRAKLDLSTLIDKKLAQELVAIIRQRIKPREICVKGELTLSSTAPNGINIIKDLLQTAETMKGNPRIFYKGAGIYQVELISEDFKQAEKLLEHLVETVTSKANKNKTHAEFKRLANE